MINWFLNILTFSLPFYIANAIPIYTKNINFLNTPIDSNKLINGKPILGNHKTIRGFIFGTISGTLVGFVTLGNFEHGFILSFTSLLGDLFGAFLKRRSKIKPGEKSFIHDRVFDILFPVAAAYIFDFLFLSIYQIVALFIISVLIHNIANFVYYIVGIKDKPW